jgi:AbrB family looped-hinge helix DNA binding protein
MSKEFSFTARIRQEGKITIPAELRDQMNLDEGTFVEVSLHKTQWYEMLDWHQMSNQTVNFSALPTDAQNYIASNYSTDSSGTPWRKTEDV